MATLHIYVLVVILYSVCYCQSCDLNDAMKCLKHQPSLRFQRKHNICHLLTSEKERCVNDVVQHCAPYMTLVYEKALKSMSLVCQAQVASSVHLQKKTQHRMKRQSGKCDDNAIVRCSQTYQSDILSNAQDQSYVCQKTRDYIANCLKANTEGCPSSYDAVISQARSSLNTLERQCGNLCIPRGPCDPSIVPTSATGPDNRHPTSEACQKSSLDILGCSQSFLTDIGANAGDQSYVCRRVKSYIQDCVKAKTVDCPAIYDMVLQQQQATLSQLQQQCGNLCLSRVSCDVAYTLAPVTGPAPRKLSSEACQKGALAILSCSKTFLSELGANMDDESYVCSTTKDYIQYCLKSNTVDCPALYDQMVKQQHVTLVGLEERCGDLCLSPDCSSGARKIYNERNLLLWLSLIFLLGVKYL